MMFILYKKIIIHVKTAYYDYTEYFINIAINIKYYVLKYRNTLNSILLRVYVYLSLFFGLII